MSENKSKKKIVGIVIGVLASVAIVGVGVFGINENWKNPIVISNGQKETTSTTEASAEALENQGSEEEVVIEDDIWGEDFDFGEFDEEEIILDGEIIFEDETPTTNKNNNINYENLDLPVITTTKKPISTTKNENTSTTKGKDTGIFGYELDTSKSHFFTSEDAWQRNFGFCKIYDDASPLIAFYYDTERIFFEYGEYDWMVQLWKGQYGFLFIGSEIGVYHKPKGRDVEFYDCAEDENCLKMKMALYRHEDELLFDRPEGYYWWTTGFVPGKLDRFADRSELKVVAKITLFDAKMTKAFLEGFEAAGFVEESEWVEPDVQVNKSYARKKFYTVSGNTVSFTWQ